MNETIALALMAGLVGFLVGGWLGVSLMQEYGRARVDWALARLELTKAHADTRLWCDKCGDQLEPDSICWNCRLTLESALEEQEAEIAQLREALEESESPSS